MPRKSRERVLKIILIAFLCGLLSSSVSPGFLERLLNKVVVSL